MNRHDNELGRSRRYSEALVTASIAATRLDRPSRPDARDWRYRPLAWHWTAVTRAPRDRGAR
jgi:hypothetical protein